MACRKAHIWHNDKCVHCENERYRKALEWIAEKEIRMETPYRNTLFGVVNKAREALKGVGPTDEI